MFLEGKERTFDEVSSQSDEDWLPRREASTSEEEELPPPTPNRRVKMKRGRGEGGRRSQKPEERWNDVDVPDIEPPNIAFHPIRSPGTELFKLFFTNSVLLNIVKNMNDGTALLTTPRPPARGQTSTCRNKIPFPKRVMTGRKFLRMIRALHLSSAAMAGKNKATVR
ncbi:uncharacterized protein V6R79_023825 [Siganus canaliculatus]